MEKTEQGIEVAISTAGECGGGRFRRPSFWYDLDKSLRSGAHDEGMPDYVVTEVKTTLQEAGYKDHDCATRDFSDYLTLSH